MFGSGRDPLHRKYGTSHHAGGLTVNVVTYQ
jgi:hypothetical protein